MIGKPQIEIDEEGKKLFLQFLFSSGFIVRHVTNPEKRTQKAQVPNEQMRQVLAEKLMNYYTAVYRLGDQVRNLLLFV